MHPLPVLPSHVYNTELQEKVFTVSGIFFSGERGEKPEKLGCIK